MGIGVCVRCGSIGVRVCVLIRCVLRGCVDRVC